MKTWFLNIERYFWLAFLFAIPFQARHILAAQGWYFNEYTAMALYGTDILLACLFLLALINAGVSRPPHQANPLTAIRQLAERGGLGAGQASSKICWLIGIFLGLAAFSISQATEPGISWYRFIKLAEGIGLLIYIRSRAFNIVSSSQMLVAVAAGGFIQALLGIAQFVKRGDLGLQVLGESVLNTDMRGVAVFFNSDHVKVLRSYGTTPHPNILATYLLVALSSLYMLWHQGFRHFWWHAVYAVVLTAFFLTFSRTIILVWAILAVWLLWKQNIPKIRPIIITTVIVGLLLTGILWKDVMGRFTIAQSDEAIALRTYYNSQALQTKSGLNWFGVGIGNFVPWLMANQPRLVPALYQPVHNIYLLVYAEIGILGLLAFLGLIGWVAYNFFRRTPPTLERNLGLLIAGGFLFIGLFDHFFWTLQQGILLWWGLWGVIAHYGKSRYT